MDELNRLIDEACDCAAEYGQHLEAGQREPLARARERERVAKQALRDALAAALTAAEARGRAAGIEAAALVADEMQQRYGVYEDGYVGGMPRVAAAIRALKDRP